ncbi:glycosyltransferase [uncultured Cellulomonas sp.]|uniref:glycosyltransferase family 4 protein n=1 Tax=uncultured Cellulomonas sp. TaxID=189682 RepID=UPI0028EDD095|nr:glycosyltransferase [uncultured Cellulomonas sp.]
MTETRPDISFLDDDEPATVRADPPGVVDRLVVHQIDLARQSPGGIETCIRGLIRHAPAEVTFAVVGVDAGGHVEGRRLGRWEQHRIGERVAWFLPVVRLDPGDQNRRIPHSVRLAAGLVRFRGALPASTVVQAHRADVAAVASRVLRRPLAYFVHTQEHGLTGATSDSFWRRAGNVHARVEHALLRDARSVVVFNPDFAETARTVNPDAMFSPTWFDPTLVRYRAQALHPQRVIWVGRLEQPKDPALALQAFRRLLETAPGDWTLDVVGTGTQLPELERQVADLPDGVRGRVRLRGRLAPEEVASAMADAGVFLMTSHPGYEGFPRVLVEAMASGLPAVVTDGSDTGSLVRPGHNGFVVSERNPDDLAHAISEASTLHRSAARDTASAYAAPRLVARIVGAPG